MEIRWLEDFLALVQHRTFARAAAVRRITQPAFGRRIRGLEDWFGTRLFVRSARGAHLTPAGSYLREPAEELLRRVFQLRQAALEIADQEAAHMSIASTHALSFVFFPAWIRRHPLFENLSPLNLISDTMEACEQIMMRGEADFMLCHYHPDSGTRLDPSQFTSIRIGSDLLVPVCAVDGDGRPRWSLAERSHEPLPVLSYDSKSGLGRIMRAVLDRRGDMPRSKTTFTAQLAVALLSMARQGQGVAWSPETLAAEDIEAGRLAALDRGDLAIDVEIRLFRPSHGQSRTAETFWNSLEAVGHSV